MKRRVLLSAAYKLVSIVLSFSSVVAGSHVFGAEVSGNQSGRWTVAASPYIVTGNIVVPIGQMLTIESGVIVKFAGKYSLRVDGMLRATGGATNRIIFTSINDRDFGVQSNAQGQPKTNDWLGIEFSNGITAGLCQFQNVIIRYSSRPLVIGSRLPSIVENITILNCARRYVSIHGKKVPFQDGLDQTYTVAMGGEQIVNRTPQPASQAQTNRSQNIDRLARSVNGTNKNDVNPSVKDNADNERTGTARNHISAFTMSQVNDILRIVATQVALRADPELSEKFNLFDQIYLVHLTNHLDLNYIGTGHSIALNPEAMIAFILGKLEEGMALNMIGLELVAEFERNGFRGATSAAAKPSVDLTQPDRRPDMNVGIDTKIGKINVGGFLVGEVEYHQEPNGEYLTLLEVNQLRLYFATEVNPFDAANNISVLAEFNPVPEEVIHQIDEIPIAAGGVNKLLTPPTAGATEEGIIPFEQLYLKINNLSNSGFGVTIGQFRNPFGLWSDFTSHRNFTSTKNNMLVNGFALKKIELGVMLERALSSNVEFRAALVHGRQGRTSDLSRADLDNKKDFIGRIGLNAGRMRLGVSGYLAEFSLNRNVAFGLDWLYSVNRLSIGGEIIYQKNNDMNSTFGSDFDFNHVSATSGYVQFDYSLSNKLHLYGLYEIWRYTANGEQVNDPAYKVFHGLRYHLHPQLRWTLVEFGRMFHKGFDEGNVHLSTQIEVIF